MPTADQYYKTLQYKLPEIEHRYGKNVHILADPMQLSFLARLCSEDTIQPTINELITSIYSSLLKTAVNQEFPKKMTEMPTRMITAHPEGVYQGPIIDPEVQVVTVNLARAGTVPSHVCYTALNYFMNPKLVRQDHISIARTTDKKEQVTGSQISGHKIAGHANDAIVLFPDPMGATGSTIVEAVDLYKKMGKPRKFIALHCIVTPEYLKNMQAKHPDVIVYAVRLDRGLSPADVLKTVPGTQWDAEKGLNSKQYIVPGGGGFGEVLNNAYV
jgi:uracil phosphoribosyltransferase